MLSRPTTDQLLDGIQSDLATTVIPALPEGPAKVMAQMMHQMIRGAAVRAAHEIAWMHDEIAEIETAAGRLEGDPAVAGARRELAAADAESLHLADVQQRYSLASEVLSCAFEAAYRDGDAAGIEELRAVLQRRSDREMQIIGTLDLVDGADMGDIALGVVIFATDQSIGAVELAREAEARGFESLWFPEHTHIPASRTTPYPGGGPLPEFYRRTLDPFVALSAAAAVTTTLKVATGICLVAQHNPLALAKSVASLDYLSNGRFVFGIGVGWNRDEMAHHGVDPSRRRDVVRENVLAMRGLWTQEEAGFSGEFVEFSPSWSWPKPAQQPHPPIVMGGAGGPVTFRHVVEYCDGWMPIHGRKEIVPKLDMLRQVAEEAGRDPASISLGVFGVPPEPQVLDDYAANGFTRIVLGLPQSGSAVVLATLDRYAPLLERFA